MSLNDQKDQKAKKAHADKLYQEFNTFRSQGDIEQSLKIEREYSMLRVQIIDEVTQEVQQRKSITMKRLESIVAAMPKKVKVSTGIRPLDFHLVKDEKRMYQELGGFTLGNFIQIAGAKYAGKTTMMMKILTHLSISEPVAWFDFEMGKEKAVDTSNQFKRNVNNINYYDGPRDIIKVIEEIKFLYADGVKHFVIDSMMKLVAKGHKRGYEAAGHISNLLSELTSTLGINIYMINQMSQDSVRNGELFLKHGNDIEYDSDYILFIMRKALKEKDEYGLPKYDENSRVIICTKNRVDHRVFTVEVMKSDIFSAPVEVKYEE